MAVGGLNIDGSSVRGKCKLCGDNSIHFQKEKYKGKYPPKPYYFKVFEQVSWFRGEDVFWGIICKACYKAGRIEEMMKTEASK